METVYRIFMFIFPYAFCIAGIIWVGKKVWRTPHPVWRWIALFFVACGAAYTLYDLITRAPKIFTNDNFIYIVMIVNVVILAFASIAMTIGEPDEKIKLTNEQKNKL